MKDSDIDKIQFGNWPMPEVYLVEIGRVNTIWSALENVINLVLVTISGFEPHDPRGIIMFEHLTMPQKLDILGSLGDQLAPNQPNLKDLPESISKIRAAQASRNKFIHNPLTYDPDKKTLEMPVAAYSGASRSPIPVHAGR